MTRWKDEATDNVQGKVLTEDAEKVGKCQNTLIVRDNLDMNM